MPTVEKLIRRAGYLIDDVMDAELAINLFNEALEEIDTVYGVPKRQSNILAAGEDTVTIPSDALEIIRVLITIGDTEHEVKTDNSYHTYIRFGEELTVSPKPEKQATLYIEYYGENEKIPDVSVDPELQYVPKIPERHHRALPLFAAVRYFENWEDNPEMRSTFRKQFEAIKDDLAYQFERKVRGSKSNRVLVERGWS